VRARSRALTWLAANAPDIAIAITLGALAALVAVLKLDGIGTGGDAMRKWNFVRQWFHGTSFRHYDWNHHMARFGIHWVTFLVQAIGGRGVNTYYVPGLIAGGVQVACVYACGKRLGGRFTGVLAAIFLAYFKGAIRASGQLMPEVFSGMYALMAFYLFLRYERAEGRRRTAWLAGMAFVLFVAYLAKETNIFFYPGFGLAILVANRGRGFRAALKDIVIVSAIILSGALLETAAYSYFTDYAHRLAVVRADHSPTEEDGPKNFWDVFDRYSKLEEFWKFAFYSFLPMGLAVVAFYKNVRVTALYAVTAGYLFLLTFCIARLEPFALWLSFRTRYFDAMSAFILLFAALFITLLGRELFRRYAEKPWARRLQLSPWASALAVLVLSLGAAGLSYAEAAPKLSKHPFAFNKKVSRIAADAYRRNLPIMAVKDNRAAMVFHMVFVNDKVLAPGAELPLFGDIRRNYRGHWWFAKDPDVYDDAAFSRMISEHCVFEVTVKAPRPVSKVNWMEPLPESCDALVPQKRAPAQAPADAPGGAETEDTKGESTKAEEGAH